MKVMVVLRMVGGGEMNGMEELGTGEAPLEEAYREGACWIWWTV